MFRCFLFLGLLGCAPQAAPSGLAPNAYLLTRLEFEERALLTHVYLRHLETGTDFILEPTGEPVLLPVPAGRYFVRRVDNRYMNVRTARYEEPETPVELLPGRTNYIGDLNFSIGHRLQYRLGFTSGANAETLRWVFATQPQVTQEYPVVAVRPGLAPVRIRAPAPEHAP